jgi:NADPH2:quinone reductase
MIGGNLPEPFIVGCDVAGTVESIGPEARRFKPGDRVWGSNQGLFGRQGTFAEYLVTEEQWLYPTPPRVSDRDAAATALVGITAHRGLFAHAQLKPGETLFVNGGAGGVGSCVVQMAKAVGARVITTAGSDEKVAAARQLGADAAINYKTEEVDLAIRAFAPSGVDLWWETLRQQNFDQIVSHLARRGRIVVMAGRDARPAFPVGAFYTKDCTLYGFAMFNATPDEQRQAAGDINRWMSEGKLRARIGRVMPLAETAAAHRLQEDNTLRGAGTLSGKIVLEP